MSKTEITALQAKHAISRYYFLIPSAKLNKTTAPSIKLLRS